MSITDKFTHCYICSDKGNYRQANEDSFVFNENMPGRETVHLEEEYEFTDSWNVCGVLDGMGGTRQGGTASAIASAVFTGIGNVVGNSTPKSDLDAAVRKAFSQANNSIVHRARYSGTTATLLVTDGGAYKLYHLGDSRAFLIHQGSILQLTKDQTVEELKKDMGLSDRIQEADRHRLTEYLGADESMQGICPVESEWMSYSERDFLILCTDGLYEGCSLREMLNAVSGTEPEKVAVSLVELALSRDIRDNVTCVFIC